MICLKLISSYFDVYESSPNNYNIELQNQEMYLMKMYDLIVADDVIQEYSL
jgi:hypothetical protein